MEEKPSESGASRIPLSSVKGPGRSFLVWLMWDAPNTYLLPAEDFPCSHLLNPMCEGSLQSSLRSWTLTEHYAITRPYRNIV